MIENRVRYNIFVVRIVHERDDFLLEHHPHVRHDLLLHAVRTCHAGHTVEPGSLLTVETGQFELWRWHLGELLEMVL